MGQFRPAYRNIAVRVASSARGAKIIQTYADKKFAIAKQDFLNEFDNHPVTQSIKAGTANPTAEAPAAGLPYGNLFSFFGFPAGQDPISKIRPILDNGTVLTKSSTQVVGNNNQTKIRINYSVKTERGLLYEKSRLFWDSGLSWLYSIETGISGLSHYIVRKLRGRSEGGVQANLTRGGSDTAKSPYINELLKGLVAKFRSL